MTAADAEPGLAEVETVEVVMAVEAGTALAGRVMVVEYFDYSGTSRKVIYYWEPIKNYLAD